ncbi:MAG: cation diffusion facilitator family transporter [Muribaculaceae bacterium]|nr:cation diffusion facilitator family transporter [Muribaculaceae bacterium]
MLSLSHQSEKQKIYTTTIIGSIANFLLVLLKFVAGFIGNSAAMIADAVHSLSDFVTDVIVIVFVRFAHKPKDELYAYGYGKYETLATAIIGVLLFIVGSGILWDGGWKIYHYFADGTLPEPHIIAFYMALVSIAVKELLYRYTAAVGRAVKSQVVVANAWHHRSDAMSSIGTAVGIGGAIFFGDGFEILDPVAAIVVSVFIMKVAIQLIIPSLGELLEKSLPEEVQEQIRQIILSYPGVSEPHHLRTRRIGNTYAIDVHLRMDGDMPLRIAHDHVSAIERKIRAAFGMQTHISIHLEPVKKPKSS